MTAGQPPTLDIINNTLTSVAVQLHGLMAQITELHLQFSVKLGAAGIQALGASQADAADIAAKWDMIGTVADTYFGKAPPDYNFDDALAPVRGGLTT